MAHSHISHGLLLTDLGQRADAEEQYRQALAILQKLAGDFPVVDKTKGDILEWH